MMGRTHAASGAVAFLLAVPVLPAVGVDLDLVSVVVGALAAAGAAMVPDLDHPGASISRAIGPITWILSRVVSKIAGGHRQATHSLVGLSVVVAISVAVMAIGGVAVGLLLSFLAALALAAFRWKFTRMTALHVLLCLAVGLILTVVGVLEFSAAVLPWAVGLGAAAHIAGDCLTKEGCPLLWPLRVRVSVLRLTTGGWVERFVVGPGLVVGAAVLICVHLDVSELLAEIRGSTGAQ